MGLHIFCWQHCDEAIWKGPLAQAMSTRFPVKSWRTAGADDSGGVHFSVRRRTRVALRVNACITLHELAPSEIFQPQIPVCTSSH
ncbi:hypothetical protein EVAR_91081_1 [Eumeta japonica]|uniref:Uncharacterized protein n=1 Tax=Eumeta variegata TaxID=151549 RepID=A0A4C1SUE3_EUMVA|nr:hypothetical protein EVAR_91081_1 [Eumeta japonica]